MNKIILFILLAFTMVSCYSKKTPDIFTKKVRAKRLVYLQNDIIESSIISIIEVDSLYNVGDTIIIGYTNTYKIVE